MPSVKVGVSLSAIAVAIGKHAPVAAPVFSVNPVVSGTRGAGNTLTTTTGTASNTTGYSIRWRVDGVIIPGETGTTITDLAAYNGKPIDTSVIATGPGGIAYAVSNGLASNSYANLSFRSPFTGANGTTITAAGNVGFDGSGNPAAPVITMGGENSDGSGANQAANRNLITIQGNCLRAVQGTYSTTARGTKILADTTFADHGVEITCADGKAPMPLCLRYTDGLNFVYLRATTVSTNTFWSVVRYNAGTDNTLYSNEVGCVGNYTNGSKFRFEIIGTQLIIYYDMAGSGTWTQGYAPASFQGAPTATPAVVTVPAMTGTYAGIGQRAAATTACDDLFVYGIDSSLNITATTPVNTNLGIEYTVAGTCLGSPSSYTLEFQKLSGEPIEAVASPASSNISAGAFSLKSVPSLNVRANQGTTIRIIARDNLGRAKSVTTALGNYALVEPLLLGINETSLGLWDIGLSGQWAANPSYQDVVQQRGVGPTGTQIASSSNGAGSTVKRDWDGRIYGTNGLGITSFILIWNNINIPTVAAGVYDFILAPGVNVTSSSLSGTASGFSYNSGTGVGTVTLGAGAMTIDLRVQVSSIPVGGVLPVLKLASSSGTFNSTAIANTTALSKFNRYLDITPANNDDLYPDRTALVHPSRAVNQRPLLNGRRELTVAHANACGAGYYHQVRFFDSDALVQDDADYIIANLATGKDILVEYSNEIWNFIFKQSHDCKMAGLRLGFAPSGVTKPAGATPETIYDAQYPDVLVTGTGTTRFTTRDYNNGEKFLYNGLGGWQVYQAIGFQASGAGFTETTNANFTVVYTNVDVQRAADRYISTRMKQIKTIWDARCALAGRPRAKMVLGAAAVLGFTTNSKPILDWDGGHLVFDYVFPAFYWGGGLGGLGNPGSYTSNAIPGWTQTTKEALYTTSSAATAVANAKTAYFSITRAQIDAAIALIPQWRKDIADYNVSKGRPVDAIKFGQYEGLNWHVVMDSAAGWPDYAAAWNSGIAYVVGNLVKSGGAIYKCTAGNTNQVPPNASFWTQIASSAVAAESPNRVTQLFTSIMLDSRFADDETYNLQQNQKYGGGPGMLYNRLGGITANGTWSQMVSEDDNITSGVGKNERFTAVKDFAATL